MATATWNLTGGHGTWSTAQDWTPAAPAPGDNVAIGTTLNTTGLMVTDDVSISIGSLSLAGRAGRVTTLALQSGDPLTVNGGIVLGANTEIDGTGTLIANGTISGTGSIVADGGTLDILGTGPIAGPVLSVGTTVSSTLDIDISGTVSSRATPINNANQTLEVGLPTTLNLASAENITNGTLLMAGGTLGDSRGISFGNLLANGSLSGFGTVTANLSRAGTGTADTITAINGTLDLRGNIGGGLVLQIDNSAPTDLKIDGTAVASTPIAIGSANQTLEIGTNGSLLIGNAETISSGTIRLDGGRLTDGHGLNLIAGATLTGSGKVSGVIAGNGAVVASGGVLDLLSPLQSTSTSFVIDAIPGSILELANTATSGTLTFAGSSGTLELADVVNGVVQGFKATIAGLDVGTSATNPTNDVNIQSKSTITSATLSGNQIKVLSGTKTVATLVLNSAPAAGTRAVVQADSTLGGYDVFLTNATTPTISWSAAPGPGVEGGAIALGAISAIAGSSPLSSVLVSNIPVGDTLTDGVGGHSFVASAGTTSINVLGWNDASLSIIPTIDTNFTLSVQATDSLGNTSTVATEAVTVDPLAPTVAPVAVSGTVGQAISLDLGIIVNGETGDANSLNSLTISNIPTTGATLSDSAGTLTPTGGSITLTGSQIAAALSSLEVTLANAGTVDLGVSAIEQDGEGNLSSSVSGTETVTAAAAAGPIVTWSVAPGAGVEGSAIALGAISAVAGSNPLTSVLVNNIPVGDTLTDGVGGHSFVAAAGTTSINVLGWNDASLSITPTTDANFTLSVQATDSLGNTSTVATEAVTVDPLAPTVAPVAVSGTVGQAISLDLGIIVNGETGDANSLNSLTISNIPTIGATLSDSAGTLTPTGGSITLTGSQIAAALSSLEITLANAGTVDLNVSAIEQDGEGNLSSSVSGTETVTAAAAAGLVISGSVNGPVTLVPSDNPVTITSAGTVASTGAGNDAVDGPAGTAWTVANNGTVTSSSAVGISLAGSGTITNAGSIGGNTGIILRGGGSVTNTLSGLISASGTIGGGDAIGSGIYITGAAGNVTNYGAISGAAYGVAMARGGSVTNSASITGGEDGVSVQGGTGTVSNTGSIIATADDGVGLFLGGTVTNAAGAFISGHGQNGAGIYTAGSIATITNSGSVTTGGSFAIFMHAGGSISNAGSATIDSSVSAIFVEGGAGTLTNAGTLAGMVVLDLETGGSVNNQAGGIISGGSIGAFITGGLGTVANTGSISGTAGTAVDLAAGGSVANGVGGSVQGGSNGIVFDNQHVGTLTNSGTISASLYGGAGASLTFGGTVTNEAGGIISGNGAGVFANSSSATIANSGSISGNHAVDLGDGGSLSNSVTGSISGQVAGLFTAGATAMLTNDGSISATASGAAAADIEAGGTVANYAGATISGTSFGVFVTGGTGTVANSGSISASTNIGIRLTGGGSVSNAANASISGAGYGVYISGSGTVTNAGTISGTPDAVKFGGAGNDRVVIDPGAVFNGAVSGGSGTNVMELAAGNGSISMAPGLFTNFGTVQTDAGSNWTLTNTDTAASELFQLDNTSDLRVAAALGTNAQISFAGTSDLGIADTSTFGINVGSTAYSGPLLESFVAGDTIDLQNFSATGATTTLDTTSGFLQIANSTSQVATLSFQKTSLGSGNFQVASDNSSGLLLTLS